MMQRLLGVETEYAFTLLDQRGAAFDRTSSLQGLLAIVRSRYAHLPDRGGSGVFLQNGARLYIDCGDHPEFSTPECANPWDAVRYVQAGERILARAAEELAGRDSNASEAVLLRCNVDYGGTGATWGCHESYLYRSDPSSMPRHIIPHLVSRIVYAGAGGFDSLNRVGLHFTLSPRVCHLGEAVSDDSTHFRGIFHTKNEPLGEGYNRLHLLCGESLCSETSTWLKVGTTALVVALIDGGVEPGNDVRLECPLGAMRAFAADPSCRQTALTADGRRQTAISIQRHYLGLAERHVHDGFMPSWAKEVCVVWRDALDRLEDAPDSVAARLDWAIKWALYTQRIKRHGLSWQAVSRWSHVVEMLMEALAQAGGRPVPLRAEVLLGRKRPALRARKRLAPSLAELGLEWDGLPSFLRLREELLEIDARFGQLGATSIFAAMDEAGVLSHRVTGVHDVESAVLCPPAGGRAHLRGQFVHDLSGAGGRYVCDWASLWDREARRRVDLRDPFAEVASWESVGSDEHGLLNAPLAAARMRMQRRFETAVSLTGESRHTPSLRLLGEVDEMAHSMGDRAMIRSALLWSAVAEQGRGEVRAAGSLLERALCAPGSRRNDSLSYKALSRRVLVFLDTPSDLVAIEAVLQETERFCAQRGRASWKSRGLLVRARFEDARGDAEAALAAANEALVAVASDPHCFTVSSYLRTQFSLLLRLGHLEEARTSLGRLRASEAAHSHRTALLVACCESELARYLGRFEAARDWGRKAVRQGGNGDDQAERVWSGTALVRALIACGELEEAEESLSSLLPLRVGQVASDRYAIRLLWADLCMNRARMAAGLSPLDAETGQESIGFASSERSDDVAGRLVMASMAYRTALRAGQSIDSRLQCDRRNREVHARLALLDHSRRKIGAGPPERSHVAQLRLEIEV